jgi:hypothetical protein
MVKKHALYTAYGDSVSDALCEDTMVDPFFDSDDDPSDNGLTMYDTDRCFRDMVDSVSEISDVQ